MNPLHVAVDAVTADLSNLPASSTVVTTAPSSVARDRVVVLVAWDGTPTDADNREDPSLRFTVYANALQPTLAADTAGGLRARLLSYTASGVFNVRRGAGRLPGVDPDTGLQFCTFSLNVALHALTP